VFLTRFYNQRLAQASYMVGCAATGEALVIDPNRDVEQYLAAAATEGVRITHVTETHIHADFVSGSLELAERTGARLLLSDEGGADWAYAFAHERNAVMLRDGSSFSIGAVRVDVLHTPGHTPEHLSLLVTDTATADEPMGLFTGDFVFVGDVGRPDLLERAAKRVGTMETSARQLFRSIQRIKSYPDYLQVWPGHGAGSACGKALGAVPQTTLGYEKRFNWAFAPHTEDEFARLVLAGQPEPPRYFAQMKRINRIGPRILGERTPTRLAPQRLLAIADEGVAIIIDARPIADFAAGHVPGAINIPLDRSFDTWAGWLVSYDRDIVLITSERDADAATEAARELAMVGLDRLTGYIPDRDAHDAWERAGRQLSMVPQISALELAQELATNDVRVIDVRARSEWEAGHLPGVSNVPLGDLAVRAGELPQDRPIVVHCQGGLRSAIAASILQSKGFREVVNLTGGFAEWQKAGLEVERAGEMAKE